MALSSIRALFDRNKYQGLGSYPESSTALQSFKWFKSKRFIRLALLLVIITSLGWFGYSTIYINQSAHEQEAAHQLVNNPAEDNLGILNDENVLKQPQQYVVEDKRLQSAKCEIPHLGRPLVQYVLVIDAGSTGSRIHVYKFNYCNDAPELEEELFEKARGENIKGLSGYPDDPEAAAHSLDSLMQTALKAVPPSLYKCTPITVKATAGLRKIDEEKGNNILRAVEQHLRTNYPFPILKENGVVIMDGKDEGVFAWVTLNYLIKALGKPEHFTAGIFEMGGASTQIVFEPLTRSFDDSAITPVKFPSDYLAAIDISGQTHKLYQHSYLGYGLDEARRQAYELLAAEAARNNRNSIDSPCFPDTFTENFVLGESMVRIYGNSSATLAADTDQQAALAHLNYERCSKLVRKILKKDHPCNTAPCSFNGVSQPRLSESLLKEQPFYVTSFFYDIASQFGLDTKFTPREFENLAKKVCQHDPSMFADAKGGEFLRSRPITCIDITYLVSILLDGVEMPPERTLSTAMTIDGFQNNWGLGVALSMLNQHRYCESSEV